MAALWLTELGVHEASNLFFFFFYLPAYGVESLIQGTRSIIYI